MSPTEYIFSRNFAISDSSMYVCDYLPSGTVLPSRITISARISLGKYCLLWLPKCDIANNIKILSDFIRHILSFIWTLMWVKLRFSDNNRFFWKIPSFEKWCTNTLIFISLFLLRCTFYWYSLSTNKKWTQKASVFAFGSTEVLLRYNLTMFTSR